MSLLPKFLSKQEFIEYLNNENYSDDLMDSFNTLPETINNDGDEYKISIVLTDNNGYYDYEFNYYSVEARRHLLPYKVENGDLNKIIKNFIDKIKEKID